jgi:peptidoglycan hydrolase CwlO-like protein
MIRPSFNLDNLLVCAVQVSSMQAQLGRTKAELEGANAALKSEHAGALKQQEANAAQAAQAAAQQQVCSVVCSVFVSKDASKYSVSSRCACGV